MKRNYFALGVILASSTFVACNDASIAPADTELNIPTSPLAYRVAKYCAIDGDCEAGLFCFQGACTQECVTTSDCGDGAICSDHGRCVSVDALTTAEQLIGSDPSLALDNEKQAEIPSQFANIAIASGPLSILDVEPGQETIAVTIRTTADVPTGAILYRIERSSTSQVSDAIRAEGTREFTLILPTGTAGAESGEPEFLNVTTSVGDFQVTLRRKVAVSGRYQGTALINQFGGGQLPIQMALNLQPEDATLQNATSGQLYLNVAATEIFSPVYADPKEEAYWLGAPLQFDSSANVWYASFASPFALPTDRIFRGTEDIQRILRIELWELQNGNLTGAISDRWQGLFSERNEEGITTLANVSIEGEFSVLRNGLIQSVLENAQTHTPVVVAPELPEIQPVAACSAATLTTLREAVADAYTNPDDSPCVSVTNVNAFYALSSEDRASCAVEMGNFALAGPTIARQIRAFMDSSQQNPGGISFGEFLTRCAAQDGFCEPNEEVECARELTAYAYQSFNFFESQSAAEANALTGVLLENFQTLLSEGFLGRQLAAYQQDTQTRLSWLRSAIVPLFLAADLRTYNEDILNTWESLVLDTHYEVLGEQLSTANLEVLARTPTDPSAIAVRETLLLELAQSWQSTMEAVNLAAVRWNELYQNDLHRRQAAAKVQRRMFELYVSAGVLAHLNYASGTAAFNSTFGPGFASVTRSMNEISRSFNDLIFMRDAEVVISTSVSPESSSNTVLRDRETLARQAIADAQDSVDRVLAEASNTEIRNELVRNQLLTQLESLRADLISLCGVPIGCHSSDVGVDPACAISTASGECGLSFAQSIAPEDIDENELAAAANTSRAGSSILEALAQMQSLYATQAEHAAMLETIRLKQEDAEAFAETILAWHNRRLVASKEIDKILEEINRMGSQRLVDFGQKIQEIQNLRANAYDKQKDAIEQWKTLRFEEAEGDFQTATEVNTYLMRSRFLGISADLAYGIGDAIAEGIPEEITSRADMLTVKTAILSGAVAASIPLSYSAAAMEARADSKQASLDRSREIHEAEMNELRDLADLDAQLTAQNISKLQEDLAQLELSTDTDRMIKESLIDAIRRNLEIDIAFELDQFELREAQTEVKAHLAELPALEAQITRAEILVAEKLLQYQRHALDAQLIESRFNALNARMNNIEQLLGSPSVIFSFANRLSSAEARLNRAKDLLYDWLVALEYYAVRPFVDQRLAILLARNPQQLEAIANHLLDLQRRCGGIVNQESAIVSVRNDLLGMTRDMFASADGAVIMHPAERFRALLRRGSVPIDTRVRYSTDENIGDVITSRSIQAVSFPIRLTDFANLPQTCNAKIASIGVELVGANLPEGLRPTVSVLYDGTSELRSCQANIDAIVGALDPGTTNFGKITRFRTKGRSVTPVARVNGFGDIATDNRGLEGLPLSSTYTLLIDPSLGDNRRIDWTQLEDIRLRIGYAYQDVFTAGDCQ